MTGAASSVTITRNLRSSCIHEADQTDWRPGSTDVSVSLASFFSGDVMNIKIAVASSDGVTIDQHFGRARQFMIYRLLDDGYEFLEERANRPPCSRHEHSDTLLEQAAQLIGDCGGVIASQIGPGAVDVLLLQRTLPLTMSGAVDDAMQALLRTNRFKHHGSRE